MGGKGGGEGRYVRGGRGRGGALNPIILLWLIVPHRGIISGVHLPRIMIVGYCYYYYIRGTPCHTLCCPAKLCLLQYCTGKLKTKELINCFVHDIVYDKS